MVTVTSLSCVNDRRQSKTWKHSTRLRNTVNGLNPGVACNSVVWCRVWVVCTMKTSSNITLTDLLLLPKLTTTQLWLQPLYHTQRAYLRTSHTSYNHSIYASLTNLLPHYISYWLTSKTETNRGTDQEQYIRSVAPTATPPASVRLAETSQLDWLNTNEWWGKAMSTITLLNITDLWTTLLTGTAQCLTYSTNYLQRLTLESWFTNLEQTPLNRCQPLPAPYKRLIHNINITNEPNRMT